VASGSVVGIARDAAQNGAAQNGAAQDEITVSWNGTYQQNIQLQAVFYQEDPATHLPASYLGYASAPVRVNDQGEVTWLGAFQPLATSTADMVLSPGDSFQGSVFVDAGDDSNAQEIARFTGNATVTLPHIDLARYSLRAIRTADAGRSSVYRTFGPADAHVSATFDPPVAFSPAPAAGSTIPRNATFQWQGGGSVFDLHIDAGKYGQIDIYTAPAGTAIGAALPVDAWSALGFDIPASTPVSVILVHFPAFRILDDALGAGLLDPTRTNVSESAPLSLILQ